MPVHTHCWRPVIWTRYVGSGDLVVDVWSGFASGSVHARLQVSVYSGYNLCHPDCPKIDSYILTPVTLKSRSNPTLLYIHVRCTHDANLVTEGPQVAEILHISIFVIAEKTMKVGHCDLLFYVQSGFTSGSLRARLQVSVYSGYDLCHPGCPQKFFVHCDPFDSEK